MTSAELLAPEEVAPEFHLLCLTLRRSADPENLEAIRRTIAAGPVWPDVINAARRHRVASLVLARLQACGPEVPAAVLAVLRQQVMRDTQRSLAHLAEVRRLSRILEGAGIPVLALKGVVLSKQFYDDVTLRAARDLDLLVDPAQYEAAAEVILASGYLPFRDAHSVLVKQDGRRWIKDLEFTHAKTGVFLELHHRLTHNPELLSCDFSMLWSDRTEVSLSGATIATLPRRFLPLYLCTHGALHGWNRLIWLVDLEAALRAPGVADEALLEAQQTGLGPLMLHAMSLAHRWLGMPVAPHDLRLASATRQGMRLNRILARLFGGKAWCRIPPVDTWQGWWRNPGWLRLYRWSLKSGWRYWRSELIQELVSPADFDAVRLPRWLFWIYPLYRPFGSLLRRYRRARA
jgi:hypothetical protein